MGFSWQTEFLRVHYLVFYWFHNNFKPIKILLIVWKLFLKCFHRASVQLFFSKFQFEQSAKLKKLQVVCSLNKKTVNSFASWCVKTSSGGFSNFLGLFGVLALLTSGNGGVWETPYWAGWLVAGASGRGLGVGPQGGAWGWSFMVELEGGVWGGAWGQSRQLVS